MPKRTPKEKVLLVLGDATAQASAEVRRWATIVNQYDADMLFNQENNLPNLSSIESSRELAKQELADAREVSRLYTMAMHAVQHA